MNKRLYGIEQISEAIALHTDEELKSEIDVFLNNPDENGVIFNLLNGKYGINKEGKLFGKATSLISKYLYFLNNFNFPIYDRLAFISYSAYKKILRTKDLRIFFAGVLSPDLKYFQEIIIITNQHMWFLIYSNDL